ncbi:MAG: hypothetical protein V2J89_17040 [Halieaceae bacterium]|jgi:hypothetical protein|nr:hypothetical protein [Halieaceae bacterium]
MSALSLPKPKPDVVGEARDLDTGETLYLEQYYCSENDKQCSVFYVRPDAKVIARKQLDYQPSPKAPNLTFEDFRLDRQITIEKPDPEAVVDAGFDNFVRLQWEDLTDGEQVRFPFRMVGRDEPISMRASRSDECEQDKLCLQIRLDSWLLGSFLDPIRLVYDKDSQRLLRFRGISNLRTAEGRTQKVDITYRYPDQTDTPTGNP